DAVDPVKALAQRVEGAGADVAVDRAQGGEREPCRERVRGILGPMLRTPVGAGRRGDRFLRGMGRLVHGSMSPSCRPPTGVNQFPARKLTPRRARGAPWRAPESPDPCWS